jgi:glycosyltransferase involved in cell wall biosynthesis
MTRSSGGELKGCSSDGVGYTVGVVIIAFNEEHNIARCVSSVEALVGLPDHRIVIVDDGSTDGTADVAATLAEAIPGVTLLTQANMGRGGARAAGVEAVLPELNDGDLVAMIDGDVELPQDWWTRCSRELSRGYDAVGGVAVPEGDATYLHRRFKLDAKPSQLERDITGNNALYRREIFQKLGFDPTLRTAEDVVFNRDLRDAGFTTSCLHDLHVRHLEDKSYVASLLWMFECGISASSQLRRGRPIRSADLAVLGWVLGTLGIARRFGVRSGFVASIGWITAVACAHVARRFSLRSRLPYAARYGGAIAANASLIALYFAGRIVGFAMPGRWNSIKRGQATPTIGGLWSG